MARHGHWLQRAVDRVERDSLLGAKQLYQSLMSPRGRAAPPPAVAFVAGVQRSGTNMLMDVLERSFVTDVIHERDRRALHNRKVVANSIRKARQPEIETPVCELCEAMTARFDALCPLAGAAI